VQIRKEESQLDFSKPAKVLHNQVRAFSGWPGTFATFVVQHGINSSSSSDDDKQVPQQQQQQPHQMQVKVLRSRVADTDAALLAGAPAGQAVFADAGNRLLLPCAGGTVLEVLMLQPPTKKAMAPKAFYNGLGGKQLLVAL
jgi:methionyl-tRNA formyltransferase